MYVKAIQKLGGQRSVLFFSKIREDFKKTAKRMTLHSGTAVLVFLNPISLSVKVDEVA